MTRTAFRRLALAGIVLPLAFGLAACDSAGDKGGSAPKLENVAPPAGKAWSEVVAKTPEGGYLMGNHNAPIKLVEYASLTCPHCAQFAKEAMPELTSEYISSGRVSFELRNFVRDPIDITAAQLTRCGAPESYFPLTEQVFANQEAIFARVQQAGEPAFQSAMALPPEQRGPKLGEVTGLTEFFAARGVASDQANACLARAADAQSLATNAQTQGDELGITGTPTFIINGEKAEAGSWEQVKALLDARGAS
jgi:protein-disulfide isomerase